ncbi:MAG: MBL fold metallo-hydrolase [Ruminococcus sp.]|nr:MBL fold metallo-hydrolase [Ruminococcus sp.]
MAKAKRRLDPVRIRLALLLIVFFIIGVVGVLHYTGIMPLGELLIRAGLRDKPAVNADTQVHFVDVGQGDCTVVMSADKVMVIDSGERDGSNTAVNYLKKLGVRRIDILIATHPHSDHIGEMDSIIESFEIGQFIMPEIPKKYVPATRVYEDMLQALKTKGLKARKARDETFELGECRVQTFTSHLKDEENLNNYSVLVKITHGENSFLVTGDCEKAEEADLIQRDAQLRSKVLRTGHHGSSTSSSAEFLDRVLPRYAVISCGRKNDYGHPDEDTVDRLRKYADKLYITSKDGTVVFYSDGEGITVKCEQGEKK